MKIQQFWSQSIKEALISSQLCSERQFGGNREIKTYLLINLWHLTFANILIGACTVVCQATFKMCSHDAFAAPGGPHVGPMNLAIRDGQKVIRHNTAIILALFLLPKIQSSRRPLISPNSRLKPRCHYCDTQVNSMVPPHKFWIQMNSHSPSWTQAARTRTYGQDTWRVILM